MLLLQQARFGRADSEWQWHGQIGRDDCSGPDQPVTVLPSAQMLRASSECPSLRVARQHRSLWRLHRQPATNGTIEPSLTPGTGCRLSQPLNSSGLPASLERGSLTAVRADRSATRSSIEATRAGRLEICPGDAALTHHEFLSRSSPLTNDHD
jgi:hypothetical protein